MIQQFTSVIQQVADPLFCKECTAREDNNALKKNPFLIIKNGLTLICVNARNEVLQALRVFERDKCNTSRENIYYCKSKYTNIICNHKRYKYELKKIWDFWNLNSFGSHSKKDESSVSTDVTVQPLGRHVLCVTSFWNSLLVCNTCSKFKARY